LIDIRWILGQTNQLKFEPKDKSFKDYIFTLINE